MKLNIIAVQGIVVKNGRNTTGEDVSDQMRLQVVIETMAHGFALFDNSACLVICNARYAHMYSLPDTLVKSGTSFEQIVAFHETQYEHAKGRVPTSLNVLDEVSRWRNRDDKNNELNFVERSSGRTINVALTRCPSGKGGWTSYHEDITDQLAHTEAMADKQKQLEQQNLRLDATIGAIPHGLAMFDADHYLVACNTAFVELNKIDPKIAVPGVARTVLIKSSVANGFAPAQDSKKYFKEREAAIVEGSSAHAVLTMSDGQIVAVGHHPIPDGGWVSFHQDITELHEKHALLERRSLEIELQNLRIDAAVNNISQGLVMFDGDRNLVICNKQFSELYSLPEKLSQRGTKFSDILVHRATIGMMPAGSPQQNAELAEELLALSTETRRVREMRNGRHISMVHQPMTDGGWVSTHEDVTVQKQNEERIHHLANHDSLTDLPNRMMFNAAMEQAELGIGRGEIMALLCLDLDRFKEVNDTLGHAIGDMVLFEVANRIRTVTRGNELAARVGGDEFMLLVGPLEQPQDAAPVAQRLIEELSKPMLVEGHEITIGTSVGIAVAPLNGSDGDTLRRNADLALYRSKADGLGVYHFFEAGMDANIQERKSLERELNTALKEGQFKLLYQPSLDLKRNRISGFEALVRWEHPDQGLLTPDRFLRVAEKTGQIVPLGKWILASACQAAARWPQHIRVSVNLSAAQFDDEELVTHIQETLSATSLEPKRLEIEISEDVLEGRAERNLQILHELRGLGIRVCLDDFGAGHASLNHLCAFPFDKIKIDRIATSGAQADKNGLDIIKTVDGLNKMFGAVMVAEGIESEQQLDLARENGCTEVQGFLFSPPLPENSATELLRVTEAAQVAKTSLDAGQSQTG